MGRRWSDSAAEAAAAASKSAKMITLILGHNCGIFYALKLCYSDIIRSLFNEDFSYYSLCLNSADPIPREHAHDLPHLKMVKRADCVRVGSTQFKHKQDYGHPSFPHQGTVSIHSQVQCAGKTKITVYC